jgi:hypothetical protein
MSTHTFEPEEVMAYVDGELGGERAALVEEHLEGCAECQSVAADLTLVSRRMSDWRVEERRIELPARRFGGRWVRWMWVPAACGLIIGVGLFIGRERHDVIRNTFALADARLEPASKARLPHEWAMPSYGFTRTALIAHSARLTLVVHDFSSVRGEVEVVVGRYHGYVADLTLNAPVDGPRSLSASLRTPAAELDATLNDLRSLGHVESESRTGEEVTQQSVDLDARLSNARNAERRLTELLKNRAGELSDVLAVEKEIDQTRERIEQMEAERKALDRRIEFARIDLQVREEGKGESGGAGGPAGVRLRNAAADGIRVLKESFVSVLQLLLSAGPSVLVWCAILFFPARLLWRRLRS